MSEDIVTRLRQEWEHGNNAEGCDYEMFAQAADEIERLREQNEYLKANVDMLLKEARDRCPGADAVSVQNRQDP